MTKLSASLNGMVHTRTLKAVALALFGGMASGYAIATEGTIMIPVAAIIAVAAIYTLPTAEEVAVQWRAYRSVQEAVGWEEPADE